MNRAEQIRELLEQIDAELGPEPIEPLTREVTPEWLSWALKAMPVERRHALAEKRRALLKEYERLPNHLKHETDA